MKATLITLLVFFVIINTLCGEEIPYGKEFQVNTLTKWAQFDPAVAVLKDGSVVVCWTSAEETGSFTNIIGQCFDATGRKKGAEFLINTQKQITAERPQIAALETGKYVISWDANYDVYYQIFDPNGAKSGDQVQATFSPMPQLSNFVIGSKDSGFVVIWADWITDPYRSWIVGQCYDYQGNKIGNELRLWDNFYNNSYTPSAAGLTDGGFIVCWHGQCKNFASNFIFSQLLDKNGEKRGEAFAIVGDPYKKQWKPTISILNDSIFVVCWESGNIDNSKSGIEGQLCSVSGIKYGNGFQINTYIQNDQLNPVSIALQNGGFVVCWESQGQDGSKSGIFGQVFDANANKKWLEFQVNSYTQNSQSSPAVAALPNGGFIVVWDSDGQDGDGTGIYYKAFPPEPRFHELQAFSLIFPINNAMVDTTRFALRWHQPSRMQKCYSWEITYDLYIDTTGNFASPKIIPAIIDTTYPVALVAGKTYYWKVVARNYAGDSLWSKEQDWGFLISQNATSVKASHQNYPQPFSMYQNYPNPFNTETTIKFQLAEPSHVVIKIFNAQGQEIRALVSEDKDSGSHTVRWDGRDNSGNRVVSGIYLYQIKAGDFVAIKRLVVLK